MAPDVRPGERTHLNERKADLVARGVVARCAVLLATGLVSGALGVLRSGNLHGGVVQAVLSGTAYGIAAAAVTGNQLRHLRALTRGERVEVVQLIRRGTAPQDPRLARAALDYVVHLRRSGMTSAPMAGLIVLAVGLLALAEATHQPLWLAAEGGVVGAWQSLMPPLRSRRRNAEWSSRDFAERQARQVLGLPSDRSSTPPRSAPRTFGIAAVAVMTAVVVLTQAVDYVRNLPRPGPDEIDRNPATAGYSRISTVSGTTIWFKATRRSGDPTPIMKVRATGRFDEACTVDLTGDDEGFNSEDVCATAERRHGGVLGFVRPTHIPSTFMFATDGDVMTRESVAIDLGRHGLPGLQLLLYVVADPNESGYLR